MNGDVVNNLLSKVVGIDNDARGASVDELLRDMLEQRSTSHGYKGFGHGVGEGLEARA